MQILKIIALLIEYPDEALWERAAMKRSPW